jgi:hypothetical protein
VERRLGRMGGRGEDIGENGKLIGKRKRLGR